MYTVKLNQFEGPLGLLLELIEKRKLSINDISLAEITGQYLGYLKQLENFPVEEVANFAVISSTLMLIKSKSLMPSLELTEEEEESIGELEERLRLYRRIKDLSLNIKNNFNKNPQFAREAFKGVEPGFIEPKGITINVIVATLKNIIEKLPKKEKIPEAIVKKIVTMEEKITELTERIKNSIELSFSEFSKTKNMPKGRANEDAKITIIISFLAMLELVKQGIVMVHQNDIFGNIRIKKD